MIDHRLKFPYLDKKGPDRKKFYTYRQWLDRYKQYTKRKYEMKIGPLITTETMTGTDEWNTKEKNMQQDVSRAIGPQAMHQITRSEYRKDRENTKIDKLIKLYNRY